jgi:tellurite resistance protein TerC
MTSSIETSFATPAIWIGFLFFVLIILTLDLFVFGGKKTHKVSVKEAGLWVLVWALLAFIFAGLLWLYLYSHISSGVADDKTMKFIAGYLIELSLSMDNMFVFVMLFNFFAIPKELQRRILLFGILGAIVMRFFMIIAGSLLIREFSWLLYIFGAFLVVTGFKMLFADDKEGDLSKNGALRWLRGHMRITNDFHGESFWIRQNGVIWFTPLLLALIFIELSDLIFAIDSIPAIFAITTDPFIVFASNIFAIMGLRALYFLLADMADRFSLLKYGLAIVLVFVGIKMLITPWLHIPVHWSLLVVFIVLLSSIFLSIKNTRKK